MFRTAWRGATNFLGVRRMRAGGVRAAAAALLFRPRFFAVPSAGRCVRAGRPAVFAARSGVRRALIILYISLLFAITQDSSRRKSPQKKRNTGRPRGRGARNHQPVVYLYAIPRIPHTHTGTENKETGAAGLCTTRRPSVRAPHPARARRSWKEADPGASRSLGAAG